MVADRGTVLALVVERAGQIAHRDDQRLLDEIRVERDAWRLAESGQPVPLVVGFSRRASKPRGPRFRPTLSSSSQVSLRAFLLVALVSLAAACGARTGLLFPDPDGAADSDAAQRPAAAIFTIETIPWSDVTAFSIGLSFWRDEGQADRGPWEGPWEGPAPHGAVPLGPNCLYLEPALYRFFSAGDVTLQDAQGRRRILPATRVKVAGDPSEYRYVFELLYAFSFSGLTAIEFAAAGDEVPAFTTTVAGAPVQHGTATLGSSYSRTGGVRLNWEGVPANAYIGVSIATPIVVPLARPEIRCFFPSPGSAGVARLPPLGEFFADATAFLLTARWIVLRDRRLGTLRFQVRRSRLLYETSSLAISP